MIAETAADLGVGVVCAGLATLDVVHVVERHPGSNEKVTAVSTTLELGGPAANAAATVVALGGRAHLVTALGRGEVAALVRSRLADWGVEVVDRAEGADGGPSVASVLIDRRTGERAVVSAGGTGRLGPASPIGLERTGAGACLVDGHHLPLCLALATEARSLGIPVVFDGGSWKPGTEDLLPLVDLALLSNDFVAPDGDDPLLAARRSGCRFAAVSRGSDAIRLHTEAGDRSIEVPPVAVVDTLGAGDVLHGATALLVATDGLSEATLPGILERAGAVAARSCAHPRALGWALDGDGKRTDRADLLARRPPGPSDPPAHDRTADPGARPP